MLAAFERVLPFRLGHDAPVDAEARYLVQTTRADLEWMRDSWVHHLTDDEIRRASGTVRRLLVDRTYALAWRTVGLPREPRVAAYSLDRYLDRVDESLVAWAVVGGATGIDHEVMEMHQADPSLGVWLDWVDEDPTDDFSLSAFLESTTVFATGTRIKRRQIIKYVANRLGGPHIGLGAAERDRPAFEILDSFIEMRAIDRTVPYLLMLAVGYAIAQSPDLQRFCEAARALD